MGQKSQICEESRVFIRSTYSICLHRHQQSELWRINTVLEYTLASPLHSERVRGQFNEKSKINIIIIIGNNRDGRNRLCLGGK